MNIIEKALADAKKEASEVIEKCDKHISSYQKDCKVLQEEMADITAQINKVLEEEKEVFARKLDAMATLRVIEKLESQISTID